MYDRLDQYHIQCVGGLTLYICERNNNKSNHSGTSMMKDTSYKM